MQRRSFLFLQGMASRFFGQLGGALQARGHTVHRINFNGGDMVFWPLEGAINYRNGAARWPTFLADCLERLEITDIILFGDCRPLHRKAIAVAEKLGLPVYVFEEGYLRPNWITLEKGGVNGHSPLRRDPDWLQKAAADLPAWQAPAPAVNKMSRRALEDILYVAGTQCLAFGFPNYRTHRPWSSWVEYAGGARRFFRKTAARRELAQTVDQLTKADRPYYLFPLQLESDSQIRHHFHLRGMEPAIRQVVRSFAAQAPADAMLLVTEHPLDTSPLNWRRIVSRIAEASGVQARVQFFEGGSTEEAILGSRGVITINSTIGYLALGLGRPLIALGHAIYDMPELTFQWGLDRFWDEAVPPDAAAFDVFRRVVAARTQINGSFFSDEGLAMAVAGAVSRIEADHSPKPFASVVSAIGAAGVGTGVPRANPVFEPQSQA
ncbi:MAG: capsular biosynthesis protein [Caulobacteraceae bacterium]|nr:capsular biosynthesis protein [Caulobacteraceae bacterium]